MHLPLLHNFSSIRVGESKYEGRGRCTFTVGYLSLNPPPYSKYMWFHWTYLVNMVPYFNCPYLVNQFYYVRYCLPSEWKTFWSMLLKVDALGDKPQNCDDPGLIFLTYLKLFSYVQYAFRKKKKIMALVAEVVRAVELT